MFALLPLFSVMTLLNVIRNESIWGAVSWVTITLYIFDIYRILVIMEKDSQRGTYSATLVTTGGLWLKYLKYLQTNEV